MKLKFKKKYFLLLFLTILFSSCSAKQPSLVNNKNSEKSSWVEIGIIENGTPKIIGNKMALLKSWNFNLLKYSQINANFNDVMIVETDGNYQLVFKSTKYKSSFYVKKSGSKSLFVAANTACTTLVCLEKKGCEAQYDNGSFGFCSPCLNANDCTKTASSFAMLSFSNLED
jgi:hypothetical protein